MSCGNHHETPCSEVLDTIYAYLDGELDTTDQSKVRQHLDECGPCLREYGLEDAVKKLIRKRCCDPAPADLRAKVLVRIQEVRLQIEVID
ncbi:MAG TPA: mycothiol system anti-sigma-R factor [Streptosporangiaceae bacterium]|jgi:mycothiol system anti-sigma-R factor|nr:mycothiol system anti-sigma-R factor [Streptosporangiaceae bacterium]